MNNAARQDYLVTEVMTATPQKLQLMLIEAALRQAQRARTLWQQQKQAEAGLAIVHCQELVTQLIAGVKPEAEPQLAQRVVGVYGFVFRALVAANLERSDKKLAEAISILEIERETWRQVCQKLTPAGAAAAAAPHMPLPTGTSFVA